MRTDGTDGDNDIPSELNLMIIVMTQSILARGDGDGDNNITWAPWPPPIYYFV